ncbi:MAG: hypothetical protein IKB10_00805 [Alphaproteobacteria bacterium]|nr:hypothetical protein [Alphaproteobacteria bacterium]
MRISHYINSLLLLCILPISTNAATTPFSQHGVIQNVQNYSSNPFWNPNSPYNQRMPQPVYATGTDVETDECQRIVASLVAAQCMMNNNCKNTQLSDIRPALMLQLSRLPGGNYATACAGFIDTAYREYMNNTAVTVPNHAVAFPTATTANPNVTQPSYQIPNPVPMQMPEWMGDMLERNAEIRALESETATVTPGLVATEFPETYADLSATERWANEAAGYAPYKNNRAYKELKIQDAQDYETEKLALKQLRDQLNQKNKTDNSANKQENANNTANNDQLITENIPEEFEALLPWYGILIVKAGSLDDVAKKQLPIISTKYMQEHKDKFFPANSDKTLGMARGCTHGNHTAHDKDVINRAAHITMNETDSFWSGNDYYVYDGEDVYWGWATIAGDVALALLTFGISAEIQAASAGTQAAVTGAQVANSAAKITKGAKGALTAANLTKDAKKLQNAYTAAKAAKAGKDTAAVASRTKAIQALADAGITVKTGTQAKTLNSIATALGATLKRPTAWVSSLSRPWKLVASGAKNIKPTMSNLFGRGATWADRFSAAKTTALAAGAGIGANYIFTEVLKGFGYSSAMIQDSTTGNVPFNSFGLLSADDQEGKENVVSHGAWISFDSIGTANPQDALNEAGRVAEELTADINKINATDPLCNVDIYVVQPAISNPKKLPGERQIYYILMNDDTKLTVRTK